VILVGVSSRKLSHNCQKQKQDLHQLGPSKKEEFDHSKPPFWFSEDYLGGGVKARTC